MPQNSTGRVALAVPPGESSVIVASDLRCSYGDFEAVRGVDLDVRRGDFFALLGTNGAGKTTTMETLEGHRPASAGTLRVLGGDPARQRRRLRPRMGIMLQESGFAGDLTVLETIRLWRRLSPSQVTKSRHRDSAIDRFLETLDLADRAQTRVRQLSGGERRRLDLILATINEPEILFLDEPTTGLDPESRERTWAVVRNLHEGGTTVVLTTHYLEEAETMADRIAIMHHGRIATSGTIAEVLGAQPTQIRFVMPAGADIDELRHVLGRPGSVQIHVNAQELCAVTSRDLQADLEQIIGWARTHDYRLERLSANEASLAEVFRRVSVLRPSETLSATTISETTISESEVVA